MKGSIIYCNNFNITNNELDELYKQDIINKYLFKNIIKSRKKLHKNIFKEHFIIYILYKLRFYKENFWIEVIYSKVSSTYTFMCYVNLYK